jgi:YHS domain-containing protein
MEEERQGLPWSQRIRSRAGWADAASYTMADLIMLRRELVIGYLIAGFLAVLIPSSAWNVIFFHGHGFSTSLENVIVGPFIALISFVCSIGNVPLAAALWKGGISFGGVVSFIFADLISLPLIFIYRKFYGWALTLRLLALMWLVMSVAGLVTEYLFLGLRLVPESRPVQIVEPTFQWNYTTYLNLVFLVVFAGIVYLYRNRERFGGGQGYALDPVCGMQVEMAHAPARASQHGSTVYFCSDRCRDRFVSAPDRYTKPGSRPERLDMLPMAVMATEIDPVCGMSADPATAPSHSHDGRAYYFCCEGCRVNFAAEPERYLASAGHNH